MTDILGHEIILLYRATTWPEMWNFHVPVPGILWQFMIPVPTLWPCTASKRWRHEIFRSSSGVLTRKNSLAINKTLEKMLK
jgi:hypothetical protein